jgi:signal transduction histidine kinase
VRRRLLAILLAFSVLAVAGFAVPLLDSTAANRTNEFVLSRTADVARFAALAQEGGAGDQLRAEVAAHTDLFGDAVVIVDERRRVVVEAGMSATEPEVAAAVDAALRNQPRGAPGELRPWSTGDVLFSQAVGTGTRVAGAVVLRSSVAPAVSDITVRWAIILLAALAAALACVLLVLRLTRWLLRPVEQLADGVHAVAAGRERTHVDVVAGPPELRGLAAEFNQMSDALAESAGRQRALVADASHQLRNPMAALRLRIDTLDTQDDSMVLELERLEALLDGMLSLASADSLATDLAASSADERCDAVTVLVERVEAWHEAADRANVTLCGPTDLTELPVRCAESDLAQVVDVVLDNGIKYAGAGSTVRWSGHAADGRVRLTIADDGPGVDADQLPRLTERFWRASRDAPGSGLGLAIAERLVTARGGTFTLHSGQRGLTVHIDLPAGP